MCKKGVKICKINELCITLMTFNINGYTVILLKKLYRHPLFMYTIRNLNVL